MRKLSNVALFALLCALAAAVSPADARQAGKWGTEIKGQVVWGGDQIPKQMPLNVNKDQQACLAHGPIVNEEFVVNPQNKGMKNVFVWITAEGGKKPPIHDSLKTLKEKTVELDQPTCAFTPHALAVREGQTVIAKNSAPVAHNISWAGNPAKNPGSNKIIPAGQQLKLEPPLKADNRRAVSVTCNIHPWMKGWIRVFDHPYYAVTDENGNFEIKMPPAGKYTIWYWQDNGWKDGEKGASGFPIEIKAGAVTDLGKVTWTPTK
jgi:plastocyanin